MISRRSVALALSIALLSGPAWSASGNAVKLFDTDNDGTLDLAEVKKVAAGLFAKLDPDRDGTLDARAALRGLHEGARDAGVTFRETVAVRDLLVREGRVVGVVTDDGEIVGDKVVVAVGIWGAELLKRHGIALPLFPVQHPYFTTAPLAVLDGATAPSRHPMVRTWRTSSTCASTATGSASAGTTTRPRRRRWRR